MSSQLFQGNGSQNCSMSVYKVIPEGKRCGEFTLEQDNLCQGTFTTSTFTSEGKYFLESKLKIPLFAEPNEERAQDPRGSSALWFRCSGKRLLKDLLPLILLRAGTKPLLQNNFLCSSGGACPALPALRGTEGNSKNPLKSAPRPLN